MFMKRISLFLLSCIAVAGCNKDYEYDDLNSQEEIPQTEIFVQGQLLSYNTGTKGNYAWPLNKSSEGWESARFSIRADGTIPDYTDKSSALYYGRFKNGHNIGRVSSLYPYGHYNDRDLDYTKRDKKTGENIGHFRYVYDAKGLKTQLAILEAPLVEDILNDEIEDRTIEIQNNKNVTKNTNEIARINALLEKGTDYLNSHVLWYVVKEVGMHYGWHVNGVITDYPVENYAINPLSKIPDNIEIDIHQQEHDGWNAIKTSIHIRTDAQSLKIKLPIDKNIILEQDDFDIRVFNYYYKEYAPVEHEITHSDDGIIINITNIPAELIEELKTNFGDGLTIEIFSYCTTQDYWEDLKKSCVLTTGKPCTINGQITSAFTAEKVDLTIMNP